MADLMMWWTEDGEPWGVIAWGDVAVSRKDCIDVVMANGYDEADAAALPEPGPLWIKLDGGVDDGHSHRFCAAGDLGAERVTGIKLL